MSVDDLVRQQGQDLREGVTRSLDLDLMLAELDRMRSRRRTAGLVATMAAVIVVCAVALAGAGRSTVPRPVRPATPSTTAVAPLSHPEQLVVGRYANDSDLSLSTPEGCLLSSTAFSADGSRAAFACAESGASPGLYVTRLPDGPPVRVTTDGQGAVAWAGQSTLVSAHDTTLEVLDPDQPASRQVVPLPQGWALYSVDVDSHGRVAAAAGVHGQSAIVTLDLSGGHPRVVLTDRTSLMFARWSPDGSTIGFLRRNAPPATGAAADVSVETVRPDGSSRRVLVRDGTAAFLGVTPGFDWSPRGNIAYVTVHDGEGQVRILSPNGTVRDAIGSVGPLAWRPAG